MSPSRVASDEGLSILCPGCGSGIMDIDNEQIDIPHFGMTLISTMICQHCGYRSSDIVPLESKPPRRFSIRIVSPEVLNIRVVRSATSSISIPEMGVRIDPGAANDGYITNVEGVLLRIRGIICQLLDDLKKAEEDVPSWELEKRTKNACDLIGRIDRVSSGAFGTGDAATLVLEDPYGKGAIIDESGDIRVEDLTDDEVISLIKGIEEKKRSESA